MQIYGQKFTSFRTGYTVYCIAGKFGEFGELSVLHQIKLVLTINNLLADLLIR